MKAKIAALLAVVLALTLAACALGEGNTPTQTPTPPEMTDITSPQAVKPPRSDVPALDTSLPAFEGKPRLLVVQDGEVDDRNSLIHTLLYTNDIDLEGIVQTSSVLHYSGDGSQRAKRWMGTEWMYDILDAYAAVYDNLKVHDPEYPAPDALRAITKVGNVKLPDDTAEATEGSDLIKERILADDSRPLFVAMGGGANTVARALMSIEEEYGDSADWDALRTAISEKVILFAFGMQDSSYTGYILPNWPAIRLVDISGGANAYGYKWAGVKTLSDEAMERMSGAWMLENLEQGRGALLDQYVTWGDGTALVGEAENEQYGTNEALLNTKGWWGSYEHQRYDFLSEGDSPAWLAVVPNGLRGLEDLSYGGWAGCCVGIDDKEDPAVRNYRTADGDGMTCWVADIQSDFAMRARWCVESEYAGANHLPEVTVTEGVDLTAAPGETVILHAEASDPDGDRTDFYWYQDAQADTYWEFVNEFEEIIPLKASVSGENGSQASFVVPDDAVKGDTIHIVLRGVDGGGTHPAAYQRVIITVE